MSARTGAPLGLGDERTVPSEARRASGGERAGASARVGKVAGVNARPDAGVGPLELGSCVAFFHSSEDMSELGDGSVRLAVTSPPYWNLKTYGAADAEIGQE